MSAALTIFFFVARHFLLVSLTLVIANVAWAILYLGLLIFAIFTNSGVGGPLAWPAGAIAISLICAGIGWGIFTPACAAGRIFYCRFIQSIPLTILVVFAVGGFLTLGIGQLIVHLAELETSATGKILVFYIFCLAIPLGGYWWISEGSVFFLSMAKKAISRFWNDQSSSNPHHETRKATFLG